MFVRTARIRSSNGTVHEYVRIVESFRDQGRVRQRVVADLGRKDLLTAMLPQLQRLLRGDDAPVAVDIDASGTPIVLDALNWGPVLVVRALFEQMGLWRILDTHVPPLRPSSTSTPRVPVVDRLFVLIANRLICPKSEHGLAAWLETDFVCDRLGRRFVPRWHTRRRVKVHHEQLDAWYRSLDHLIRGKKAIETALYHQLRDLFSLQPDLVFYDITSTYFEGAGPDLAKHGYSRDGKPQNVQVIVALVLVQGWPIAHYVFEGNRQDVATVRETVKDLRKRFSLGRIIFVGDRGMVSVENIQSLRDSEQHDGYLVGIKRRQNPRLDEWLAALREDAWVDCPMGTNVREKRPEDRPRTRVQEVPSGDPDQRVFIIDSDERRAYEESKRKQAMERVRVKLESVERRVRDGDLQEAAAIGAAAERALRDHHGSRYYAWEFRDGAFRFFEHPVNLPREKRLEGKYVIATSETGWTAQEAVATYKQLIEVERGFRNLKDVLELRPIYHRVDDRVRAHIFVAFLALLLQTLLTRRLTEAGANLSAPEALKAVETIRHVSFQIHDETRAGTSNASSRAQQVLRALGITDLRPPTPPNGETTTM